jgi:hypothetical protein
VSDSRIKSVHFGEAKTVLEFFRKERWRGQGNLRGLQSHGFYSEEVPSLLLPIYYLIAIVALPLTTIHAMDGSSTPLVVNVAVLLLPALFLALRTSFRVNVLVCFGSLGLLYLVYALARASALISLKQTGRSKDLLLRKVP